MVWEDHFYPEIIDPASGDVLPDGAPGELVFTTLTKEGLPLIRYRTRDITSLNYEPCACGRTSCRITKISGRSDDMLIIRGVNVFPSQIEDAILKVEGVTGNYFIIVDRANNLDTMEIQVEISAELFSDYMKPMEALERKIKKSVEDTIGLSAKIVLAEPKTIARSEGKAKRVEDRRKI